MKKTYSVEEACDIFAKGNKLKYIRNVLELPDKFLLAPAGENGEIMTISCLCAFDKKSGKMATYFPPDHKKELSKAKKIEVPEKYRFKG